MEKILKSIDEIASRNQQEVIVPNGYTAIGEFAFKGCTSLASVVIPDSVTKIGKSAFKGCTSLASVVIPHSARWNKKTFGNGPKLTITRR